MLWILFAEVASWRGRLRSQHRRGFQGETVQAGLFDTCPLLEHQAGFLPARAEGQETGLMAKIRNSQGFPKTPGVALDVPLDVVQDQVVFIGIAPGHVA